MLLKAELFVNGTKYDFEKKVISHTKPLEAYDVLRYEGIELPEELKFDDIAKHNDIFVRYFAKKVENAPWVLVKIDFLDI